MRREFADSGESAARFDDVPDVPGRQRLTRSEVSAGNIRQANVDVVARMIFIRLCHILE